MHLLKNPNSRKWMKSCRAWFLIKDYANFKKLGYVERFIKIYNCTDTKEMKDGKIKEFFKKKINTHHFIIDMNPNFKRLIKMKNKNKFMVIPLVSCNENMFTNSSFGYPVFTGWFWNDSSQKALHITERSCLQQILKVSNVRDQLNGLSDNLNKYWVKQSNRLHVTAKYIGDDADEDSIKYLDKVYNQFYTTVRLKVTGILLTPRNISGHAELSEEYKWMFDPEKQDEFDLLTHVTLATSKIGKPVDSGPDQIIVQTMIKEKKTPIQEFDLEIGKLQDWGECRFYVVLKTERNFRVMFLPKLK